MSSGEPTVPRPKVAEAAALAVGQAELLQAVTAQGLAVRMRVHGLSMMPFIRDDDVVTVAPLAAGDASVGDVVAFTLPEGGKMAFHRLVSRAETGWLLRGDSRAECDGVVPAAHILGKITRVERRGRDVAFGTGIAGTGIAWMSRAGGLHQLMVLRGRLRRVASLALLRAQSLRVYRVIARRLLGPVTVEEADQADAFAFRLRHCPADLGTAGVRVHDGATSTWVAKRRGRIVGLVDLVDVEAPDSPWTGQWLSWIGVRVRYRGGGIGEALVSHLAAQASSHTGSFLSVVVTEDNAPAIGLLRKLEFMSVATDSLEPISKAEERLLGRRPMVMQRSLRPWAEGSSLSSELRTLVLCAQAIVDPRRSPAFYAALAECPDAGLLSEAAIQQGMLGSLHRMVANRPTVAGPPVASGETAEGGDARPGIHRELLEMLTSLQRIAAQRSLRQTAQLLRVITLLREAGVEVMPYKGPVSAQCLYGDVTARTWEDLDLIVRHEKVLLLRQVLLENGFVDASSFSDRVLARRTRGWGEIAFRTEDSGLYLDVHWNVAVGFSAGSLAAERLLARAGSTCLLGTTVGTPSAIDTLIISCINGTKDRWNNVEELLGVGVQVLQSPRTMWVDALSGARSARCYRRTVIGVAHACRVLGMEVPQEVAQAVVHDAVAIALLRSLVPDTLDRGRPAGARTELARLIWRFTTEDSLAGALWHATTRFFRPGPEDWEWLAVPAGMSWLYRLLRPVRLAVKWAKRL